MEKFDLFEVGDDDFGNYFKAKNNGDMKLAYSHLKTGCEKKCGRCLCEMGLHYVRGTLCILFEKEAEKSGISLALEHFKQSSEQGFVRGTYQYGHTLMERVNKQEEGQKYLLKAFDEGDNYAKGRLYLHGWGKPQVTLSLLFFSIVTKKVF